MVPGGMYCEQSHVSTSGRFVHCCQPADASIGRGGAWELFRLPHDDASGKSLKCQYDKHFATTGIAQR